LLSTEDRFKCRVASSVEEGILYKVHKNPKCCYMILLYDFVKTRSVFLNCGLFSRYYCDYFIIQLHPYDNIYIFCIKTGGISSLLYIFLYIFCALEIKGQSMKKGAYSHPSSIFFIHFGLFLPLIFEMWRRNLSLVSGIIKSIHQLHCSGSNFF